MLSLSKNNLDDILLKRSHAKRTYYTGNNAHVHRVSTKYIVAESESFNFSCTKL